MDVTVLHSEPGPHEGWTCYFFAAAGERDSFWRLMTSNDERPRSHISPAVLQNGRWECKPGGVKVFDGILSPQAAYEILRHLNSERTIGFSHGAADARQKIRSALGL